jgi:hypothetical protein
VVSPADWGLADEEEQAPSVPLNGANILAHYYRLGGSPDAAGARRTGNRVSLLPISQYCGKAGELSEKYGAGRPAAMGSAFHALVARAPDAQVKLARLTDRERAEVLLWQPPATVVINEGRTLDYAEALKEFEVSIEAHDPDPIRVLAEDRPVTVGHVDMAWVKQVGDLKVAFVGDIKKTIWTTEDGPESLQLHGYGWGTARKFGCDAYCTGLWCATEGEWLWSKDWIVLDSDRGRATWDRIYHAATNVGEASTGGHCNGCYARLHCPEHLLPTALSQTFLAPVAEGGDLSTVDHAFVLKLQALEKTIDAAKKLVQAAIERGELQVRDPDSGKVYGPVKMPGREGLNKEKLLADLGDKASEYVTKGAPYSQFRWKR